MKTNPNDPTNPTTEIGNNGEVVQGFGFTKREHIAIEFTKAILSSRTNNLQDMDRHLIGLYCSKGIQIADELIKQLNKDEK